MTSRDIAELTGKEHRHVMRDIDVMFAQLAMDAEGYVQNWTHPQNHQEYRGYALPRDLSITLVSGYDAKLRLAIIRRWDELEAEVKSPPQLTPAEMFLQNAQVLVAIERRQADSERAVAQVAEDVQQISADLTKVKQAQTVLNERPQGSESLTHIRPRAAKEFGLPERVIEFIIRNSPYRVSIAAMVKNSTEQAMGATFAVFWTKDVNAVLRRFVSECTMVTPFFAVHPYIEGRFRLVGKVAA